MPKHKLGKEYTAICKGCRHASAAHKDGACKMHNCKCGGFKGGGLFKIDSRGTYHF